MTRSPGDPEFATRVRTSFERQALLATLGATLARVDAGEVEIELAFRPELNLLAPARDERFRAIGRVVRSGRTVTVTSAELRAATTGEIVAIMTGTMMTARDRPGFAD